MNVGRGIRPLTWGGRVLTVRLPWAWAIAAGHKPVENRTVPTKYRGPVAIHAAAGWSRRGGESALCRRAWWGPTFEERPPLAAVDMGGYFRNVLAVARLAGCHEAMPGCCGEWGETEFVDSTGQLRTGVWHWTLADVRRIDPPLPARGRLGLWRPDPDLADALAAEQSAHRRASAL